MKNLIKKILGITALQAIIEGLGKTLDDHRAMIEDLNLENSSLERQLKSMTDKYNKVDELHKLYFVGADISLRGNENWAVVCIKGKPEYMQFVDLRNHDAREIAHFLRKFEDRNVTIDAPAGMSRLIRDFKV